MLSYIVNDLTKAQLLLQNPCSMAMPMDSCYGSVLGAQQRFKSSSLQCPLEDVAKTH